MFKKYVGTFYGYDVPTQSYNFETFMNIKRCLFQYKYFPTQVSNGYYIPGDPLSASTDADRKTLGTGLTLPPP